MWSHFELGVVRIVCSSAIQPPQHNGMKPTKNYPTLLGYENHTLCYSVDLSKTPLTIEGPLQSTPFESPKQ